MFFLGRSSVDKYLGLDPAFLFVCLFVVCLLAWLPPLPAASALGFFSFVIVWARGVCLGGDWDLAFLDQNCMMFLGS